MLMKKLFLTLLLAATTMAMYATEGGTRGVFSVSATKKVVFSQGNLQYQASTSTWRFASTQYTIAGADNANIASNYSGWIDLFGWGTGNAPATSSTTASDYSAWSDWGAKAISNGGNTANSWQTLTQAEWQYLLINRPNAINLFALGKVEGICGLIILPDNWVLPSVCTLMTAADQGLTLSYMNNYSGSSQRYNQNVYDSYYWGKMEEAGAIFLPAAGYRNGQTYNYRSAWQEGYYWMSDITENNKSRLIFSHNSVNPASTASPENGYSVRLTAPCVDRIDVQFEAPKAGKNVIAEVSSGSSNFNVLGKVTIPDGVHYYVDFYRFMTADGGAISESKFSPNTTYQVRIALRAQSGYTFPMVPSSSTPYTKSMSLYVNNAAITSAIGAWDMVTLMYNFTTGDAETVAVPTFSNTYDGLYDTAHIALTCGTVGANIYYTTDGSTPSSTNGTLYNAPISVNVTSATEGTDFTIKAIAIKDDTNSEVVSHTYRLYRTECTLNLRNGTRDAISIPLTAKYGDEVTVTPISSVGCGIDRINVQTIGDLSGNTFVIPAHQGALDVYVYMQTFNVTINAGVGGSVNVADANAMTVDISLPVTCGTKLYMTAVPNAGYQLDQWTNYNPETGLTVTSDITVSVSFKAAPVKIGKLWYLLDYEHNTATIVYSDDYNYAGQTPESIPASVVFNNATYAVTAIADGGLSGLNVSSLSLPEGIVSIGNSAFQNSVLQQIGLPSTLKTIGDDAFVGSLLAGTLIIPANVETIGNYAFYNLSRLDAIDIQSTKLQTIGAYAFANTKTEEITLPATITSIGTGAFSNVSLLNKVIINAVTPPTLANEAGTFLDHNTMIPEIYVPLASLNAYKQAWPVLAPFIKANVAYTITFKEYDGTVLCSDVYGYQEIPTPCDRNGKPSTTEHEYDFDGWMRQSTQTKGIVAAESDETYIATYSEQPRQYTITFMDGTTTLQTRQLGYGQMAEFTGTEPTRANLEFAGWSPALTTITGDATYTAVFKARIIFNDEWGKEWQNSLWEVGATPVYSGATPTHAATAQYSYEFQNWPTISAATQNATYTAIFSQTVRKYNIVFKVIKHANETVVQQEQLEYGTTPIYKGAALDYVEGDYVYHHTGWNPEIRPVDGNEDYVATFSSVSLFTVYFYDCNGVTILKTEKVQPGQDATAPTASQQAGSIITGWDKAFTNVQSDLHVFAECTSETYTVTLIAENGSIAVTDDQGQAVDVSQPIAYGTMLTLVATGNEGYVFDKWENNSTENTRQLSVTSDITLTAYFKVRMCEVTVVAEHGSVSAADADNNPVDLSQPIEYGKVIFLTATPDEHWLFDHWDGYNAETGLTVTDNITVTAVFVPNTEGFENILTGKNAAKVLIDGQIFILRGEKFYTLQGAEVK